MVFSLITVGWLAPDTDAGACLGECAGARFGAAGTEMGSE